MSDQNAKPKSLCMISVDGGGVRGISSILIFLRLMQVIDDGRPPQECLRYSQMVDMIGGTGTGALIAVFLGRLGMSAHDCFRQFLHVIEAAFGREDPPTPGQAAAAAHWPGDIIPIFDAEKLKKALIHVVVASGLPADAKLNDGEKRDCLTFVCVSPLATSNVTVLRDYTPVGIEPDINSPTIVEACLAAMATVNYFEPTTIGYECFADALYGGSNPVDQVYHQAEDYWNDEDLCNFEGRIACLLSVGTGHPGNVPIHYKTLRFYGETLTKIAQYNDQKDQEFKHTHRYMLRPQDRRYFRFNVDQGLQTIGFAECEQIGNIKSCTDFYLGDRDNRFDFKRCASILRSRSCLAHPMLDAQQHD